MNQQDQRHLNPQFSKASKQKLLSRVLAFSVLASSAAVPAVAEITSVREILNFNTGWLYSAADYTNAAEKSFDDSGFTPVSVPHANKVLEKHTGADFPTQIDSYRFISWYRRHFALPESYSGKRIMVEFEAVATVAEVYVNGSYVGGHKGAYNSFTLDITDYVKTGGADNVIAVRVDSTKRTDIPPEGRDVDYCLFGGIVRDVNMIITDPLHVDWTFITTPDLAEKAGQSSRLYAQTNIVNSNSREKTCTVETKLYDAEGNLVTEISSSAAVPAGGTHVFEQYTPDVTEPHLWSPDDPYLYTVVTQVLDGSALVDRYETVIGFRWFQFNETAPDANFYLNGEKLKIRGVNRHEQWPWQGRAIPNKLQAADADLVKDTGFNTVRCSHYPQDPEFLKRCDEIGLLVFEEAPGWQHVGNQAWQEMHKTNLEDMIIRDRNHASIISWGVRINEALDNPSVPENIALAKEAAALAKALDPTRPTHGVRREFDDELGQKVENEDLFAVNYRYPETPSTLPYVITEHSMDWFSGNGRPGASDAAAAEFTKSFADVMDYYYRNDLVAGGIAWSMFDYNNEVNYTKTDHVFYSGMYDIFRLDKPVSHLYRAQKDPDQETVLYIANYWTADSPDFVHVYSNCDEVELFVNGVSKGRITPNLYPNIPRPAFEFSNITYAPGELKAVGYRNGEKAAEAVRKTPGAAAKLILTPDYTELTADGSDMTSVTITAVDENGTRVPYADNAVTIRVEGAGNFIGEPVINLEGGRAAFLIRTDYMKAGTVTCTANADGLTGASCTLDVLPYEEIGNVPFSSANGTTAPIPVVEVNDTVTGTEENQFQYTGSWIPCFETNCYSQDNTYSSAANDTCTITFTGKRISWYGATAPAHGIMAVSIDGGEETLIDCYSELRFDNLLLFDSGVLPAGQHTLKVRVTGTKNDRAENFYINADRVVIAPEEPTDYPYSFDEVTVDANNKLHISVTYRGEEANPQHTLILASYTTKNLLDHVAFFPITGSGEVDLGKDGFSVISGQKLKILIWEGTETLNPLSTEYVQ